nr:MAG TPA: hypothetical protein [Caudoviricetes sp.]
MDLKSSRVSFSDIPLNFIKFHLKLLTLLLTPLELKKNRYIFAVR